MNGTGDGGQEVFQKIPRILGKTLASNRVSVPSIPEEQTAEERTEESPHKEPRQNSVRFGFQDSYSKSSDEPKKQTSGRMVSSQRPSTFSVFFFALLALATRAFAQLQDEFVEALAGVGGSPLLSVLSTPGLGQSLFDEFAEQTCPRLQDDTKQWTESIDLLVVGYQKYFNDRRLPGDVVYGPGICSSSYVGHEKIKSKMREAPQLLLDGDATKENALGLLRLNDLTFESGVWSNGYRGLFTAIPQEDHDLIRPFVDYLFGDGNPQGATFRNSGTTWTKQGLLESAQTFLADKENVLVGTDTNIWVISELHKISLGVDLTPEEARQFAQIQGAATLLAISPAPSIHQVATAIGLPVANLNAFKTSFVNIYENVIKSNSNLMDMLDGHSRKGALALLDTFLFAGGLSVPSVIQSSIAAYMTCLTDEKFDATDAKSLTLLALESIRLFPPVLAFPYILKNGQRQNPLPGFGGYDRAVYGNDADEFRIRGDISYYHSRSLNWADAALPVQDQPKTARVCSGRSLSLSMASAFLEALDLTRFYVDPETEIVRGNGPNFWNDFNIIKSDGSDGSWSKKSKKSRCPRKKKTPSSDRM